MTGTYSAICPACSAAFSWGDRRPVCRQCAKRAVNRMLDRMADTKLPDANKAIIKGLGTLQAWVKKQKPIHSKQAALKQEAKAEAIRDGLFDLLDLLSPLAGGSTTEAWVDRKQRRDQLKRIRITIANPAGQKALTQLIQLAEGELSARRGEEAYPVGVLPIKLPAALSSQQRATRRQSLARAVVVRAENRRRAAAAQDTRITELITVKKRVLTAEQREVAVARLDKARLTKETSR